MDVAQVEKQLAICTEKWDKPKILFSHATSLKKHFELELQKEPYEKWETSKKKLLHRCVELLCKTLSHKEPGIQVRGLDALAALVKVLGQHGLDAVWQTTVKALAYSGIDGGSEGIGQALSDALKPYLSYHDMRFYLLVALSSQISEKVKQPYKTEGIEHKQYNTFVYNTFEILKMVEMATSVEELKKFYIEHENLLKDGEAEQDAAPKRKKAKDGNPAPPSSPTNDDDETTTEPRKLNKKKRKMLENRGSRRLTTIKGYKKIYSEVWTNFVRLQLTKSMRKEVVLYVAENVLPSHNNPLLFIDFFTHAYSLGGVLSLLALHGLFILIANYNLDYPDFYKNLYALLEPSVFYVKYRSRFFRLVQKFLSSSYLPAYVVASCIKRLCRLALIAPIHGCAMALALSYNLLARHPACMVLIHRPPKNATTNRILLLTTQMKDENEQKEDPYNPDEPDPSKTNAMNSSLWELEVLKSHYMPMVSGLAKLFDQPDINKTAVNLEDFLEHSYDSIFRAEIRRKAKTVPLEFRRVNPFAKDQLGYWH